MKWPKLSDFPVSVRVAISAYLITTGFGYNYAIANVAMKVGTSPKVVAAHYGGGKVPNPEAKAVAPAPAEAKPAAPAAPAEEEALDLDDDKAVDAPPPPPAELDLPAPSAGALVQEGHTHIFGMGSLFFGVVFAATFLAIPEGLKSIIVATPFFAIILDHLGFLGTRFLGKEWVYAVMAAGSLMALSHIVITALSLWQMWFKKSDSNPKGDA